VLKFGLLHLLSPAWAPLREATRRAITVKYCMVKIVKEEQRIGSAKTDIVEKLGVANESVNHCCFVSAFH
jgi:hypothetical protein